MQIPIDDELIKKAEEEARIAELKAPKAPDYASSKSQKGAFSESDFGVDIIPATRKAVTDDEIEGIIPDSSESEEIPDATSEIDGSDSSNTNTDF